jgi:hypothetical protein
LQIFPETDKNRKSLPDKSFKKNENLSFDKSADE